MSDTSVGDMTFLLLARQKTAGFGSRMNRVHFSERIAGLQADVNRKCRPPIDGYRYHSLSSPVAK
jgi:hypothetical protein